MEKRKIKVTFGTLSLKGEEEKQGEVIVTLDNNVDIIEQFNSICNCIEEENIDNPPLWYDYEIIKN